MILITLLTFGTIAKSQTQADTSDTYWSIVIPIPLSSDIDLKECLVNSSKDSLVQNFVINSGSWAFRVDSIYFRGDDASAFSLVSGLPVYELNEKEGKNTEFRFSPLEARKYEAEIVIITQAETLVQKIRGEGIEEQLSVFSGWLDFGKVEIGNDKIIADTILLTNISGKPITIDDVQIIGPDTEQFKIENGGGSFTLNATESRKMSIKFEPNYGGRTSSQIAFSYKGVGSPAKVNLFGTGIGGSVYVVNDSAYIGESKNIKIYLSGIKPNGLQKISSKYKGIIRFHKNLLGIKDNNFDWKIINDSIYVTLIGNLNNSLLLAEVPVVVGLGHTDLANIEIVEMNLIDDLGNIIDYEFTKENGEIKILGICEEGGTRLINPSKITKLMQISPNPSDGKVSIEFNLLEKGNTTFKVFSVSGELIEERIISNQSGNINIELDTKNYGNGLYFIHLQTPAINKIEKLIIYR